MARGRDASIPTNIPREGWMDIAARVARWFGQDRISLVAAGVAFFGILALFPAITALLAVGGLVLDPSLIVSQMDRFQGVIPADALSIIRDQATSVAQADGLELALILSIGLALWSSSRGVATLCDGLNIVYEEDEKRGFFKKNATFLVLTALMMLGILVAIIVIVALPVALQFLSLDPIADLATRIGTWALLIAMTIGGISILYRFGPSRSNARWGWISPGAILACVCWMAASFAFTIYVSNFASYNESFGAIAGVIILLMWLWISAMVILVGGKVNAEMEHQTRKDTTTGPEKPMGARGAAMADTLGQARGEQGET
ncbi:YihY/virulence factor BrkB family protein [Aliiroseovarius sp. S1339]|uniref:YihY/virulence factor BrkB family protein n=1 Tax=Aliiroseovarius sp. S1339 TaxID=2936990 RepID=UPI0020C06615|nr:YihY/virulence factor BrkB family protein [Aliiroseovarius sp. S1339]MCK8463183.1 YihY/virulence factor BrkB family protein [Aliiroseovarius sp. S1339]